MKSEVRKVRRYFFRRSPSIKIVNTETRSRLLEQGENILAEPGRVPEFKDISETLRQDGQKSIEPLQVKSEVLGKLKKKWAKMLAQRADSMDKTMNALRRIPELFHVGDETARFHREKEMGRSHPNPRLESGSGR